MARRVVSVAGAAAHAAEAPPRTINIAEINLFIEIILGAQALSDSYRFLSAGLAKAITSALEKAKLGRFSCATYECGLGILLAVHHLLDLPFGVLDLVH